MNKAIIFIYRGGFDYYVSGNAASVRFPFDPVIVRDLEVLNIPQLEAAIAAFIASSKLVPSHCAIILSDSVLFMKDLQKPAETVVPKAKGKIQVLPVIETEQVAKVTLDDMAQKFVDTVPFEDVASMQLPIPNGIKVLAVNRELYMSIKLGFEKSGFFIENVSPLIALGRDMYPEGVDTVKKALAQFDMTKAHSFLTAKPFILSKPQEKSDFVLDDKKSNTRLFAMLGVFGVLFLILGILLWQMLRPQPVVAPPIALAPTVIPRVLPTSIVTPAEDSSAAAALAVTDLVAEIIDLPKSSSQAASLKKDLEKFGFAKVVVSKNVSLPGAKTTIVFASAITPVVREQITKRIQAIVPNISAITSTDTSADVIVTLGR